MSADFAYIPKEVVRSLLNASELLVQVEGALGRLSRGEEGGVIQPERIVMHLDHGNRFLAMPSYSRDHNVVACKLVSSYPGNASQGITTHPAYITLFDPSNGVLLALVDGDDITAVNGALTSAVATKYLAQKDSKVLALLGSGAQARSHHAVLSLLFDFQEVRVWSRTAANAAKLATEINGTACASPEEAVKDADIICTVSFSDRCPLIPAGCVKPGAHINIVGASLPDKHDLDPELMRSPNTVVYTDGREGAMKESGDIILSKAEIYAEIGEVVTGHKKAFPDKTTVFKATGMAVADAISTKYVYEKYINMNK